MVLIIVLTLTNSSGVLINIAENISESSKYPSAKPSELLVSRCRPSEDEDTRFNCRRRWKFLIPLPLLRNQHSPQEKILTGFSQQGVEERNLVARSAMYSRGVAGECEAVGRSFFRSLVMGPSGPCPEGLAVPATSYSDVLLGI